MEIYDCGHKGSKMAKGCLKHIIEKGNEEKFFIATNDKQVKTHFWAILRDF
jgi:U3 small nucleolar RNA-associated protein 23